MSLEEIHKKINRGKLTGKVLCLHGNDLRDSVLGLHFLNLKRIYFDNITVERAFEECRDDDIHALQERLIDAGLSRLARLKPPPSSG